MKSDLWVALLRHWYNMICGQSYWHASQGLGPCFQPGQLQDYYRDYSTKVVWHGDVDQSQFPLVREPSGKPFHDPLVFAQKALGHWSCWLTSFRQEEAHRQAFLALADWLVTAQEVSGAWFMPTMNKSIYTVPYNALTQGQAISVLARAFSSTSEQRYLDAAWRGLQFMLKPMEDGGTSRSTVTGLVLEEYPRYQTNTVLNGWISALFGVYDVLLLIDHVEIRDALEASLQALIIELPTYDAKYWSFYDSSRSLASPYYHRVHVTQLRALELTFPSHSAVIRSTRLHFEEQLSSSICRTKAFILKAAQTLRQPPVTVRIQSKAC